ncbi:MAG: choice-of-anchor D domain-containing protein [Nitrospinae bacterium]|nr:choice-of-anchor D domain-containing protein [Nitrospinota bacterium]
MKTKGWRGVGAAFLSWLLLAGIGAGAAEGALLRRENVELVKQIGGSALSVTLQGNLAYLGLGPTLHLLDVKRPESPELKGRILLPGLVKGIAVSGRHAYVANGKGGLRIVNVAIPASPREVGATDIEDFAPDIPEEAVGIYVSEQGDQTYAYVAAGKEGLRVIDVSDPSAPREVASYPSAEEIEKSATEGEGAMTEVRGVYVSAQGDKTYAYVVGELAKATIVTPAAKKKNLWVLDVSDPASPKGPVAELAIEGEAAGVDVSHGYVYVAAGEEGLTVARIEADGAGAISSLEEVGHYKADGYASGVVVSGPYAYMAYGKRGLRVIQVENPSFLREVGTYRSIAEGTNEAMPTFAYGIAATGSYAYLANGRLGLEVVELLNPAAPKKVADYHDAIGFVSGFFASGQDACAVAGTYGLDVLKIADPLSIQEIDPSEGTSFYYTRPQFEDRLPLTQGGMFISGGHPRTGDTGGHLFLATGELGLAVGDIKPDFTGTAGFYPPLDPQPDEVVRFASGVFVVGTTAYLADRDAGLIVLDVSNPIPHAHPNPVKRLGQLVKTDERWGEKKGWGAEGIFVAARGANTYAYVAAGEDGLKLVDVTNPAELAPDKEIGALDTPAPAVAAFISGNYAYVAAGDLLVVDVSDPTKPEQRGRYDVPGRATWVQVANGLAYVVDQAGGLLVVDVSDPDFPSKAGHFDTPGQIQGVFVSGGYAYVSDGDGGLLILRYLPPAPPGPDLVLDPSNLWFGEVVIDTTRELSLTLSNRSVEDPVMIGSLWIEGEAFSLVETALAPFSLTPGESQAIQVRFSPTLVGLQRGVVTLISDDPQQGALSLPLAGQGVLAPDINLSQTLLGFGEVAVGDSQELEITLSNEGEGILTVRELPIDIDRFAILSPSVPFQVAPKGSRQVVVRFSPQSPEPQSAILRIVSNDPDESPFPVTLSGNGVPVQLAINGGANSTLNRKVILGVSVPKDVSKARFSNDGSKWSSWKHTPRVRSWSLSKGEGVKQVWGEFKTDKGRVLRASDTITLKGKGR